MIKIEGNKKVVDLIKSSFYEQGDTKIIITTDEGEKTIIVKQMTHVKGDIYTLLECDDKNYCGFIFPHQICILRKCA